MGARNGVEGDAMTAIEPTAHHPLGCSSWDAWAVCPSFQSDQSGDMTAAENGQDAHRFGAALIRVELGDTTISAGQVDGLRADCPEELREGTEWYAGYVLATCLDQRRLKVEERVEHGDGFAVLYYGTADAAYAHDRVVDIWDLKTERKAVSHTYQMAGYALPLMESSGADMAQCHICRSRAQRADVIRITLDEARAAWALIRAARAGARKPAACAYCDWCANRATCSETARALAMVAANRRGMATPTDIAWWLDLTEAAQTRIDAIREAAKTAMIEQGIAVPGWRVTPRAGKLVIPAERVGDALAAAGVDAAEVLACAAPSVAAMARARMARMGEKKAAAERAVKAAIADIAVRAPDIAAMERA
jgi:hypothetical protein